MAMKLCRECKHEISKEAITCPHCGTPYPAKEKWDGWGFEYKSKTRVMGWPLVHIAFKYRPNRTPIIAKGIFAIGQFACGVVTISQFGIGFISVSQFTLAWYALAQMAVGYSIIAQLGLYFHSGRGQLVKGILDLLGMVF